MCVFVLFSLVCLGLTQQNVVRWMWLALVPQISKPFGLSWSFSRVFLPQSKMTSAKALTASSAFRQGEGEGKE